MKIFDTNLCGALHEYGCDAFILEMDSELVSVWGAYVYKLRNEKERYLAVVINVGNLCMNYNLLATQCGATHVVHANAANATLRNFF